MSKKPLNLLLSPYTVEQRYNARLRALKKDLSALDEGSLMMAEDIMIALYEYLEEYDDPNIENAILNLGQSLHWVQCFINE
jgi:hypothetical protein